MRRVNFFLSAVSAAAIAAATASHAQTSLPSIDIGKPKKGDPDCGQNQARATYG